MPGIIYVLLIFLLGGELVPKAGRTRLWLFLPASFGLGALAMGWTSYAAAFAADVCLKWENPLFYGNLAAMAGAGAVLVFRYASRGKKESGTSGLHGSGSGVFSFASGFSHLDHVLCVLH